MNRIGVEAHAHARPLRINTASTRRGRNRVRSGRTINRSLTNKVRYLGTRRPRVTKEKRQIKWITCIITMRAFIAHRQTFVIWGCIYLWDSNPFSIARYVERIRIQRSCVWNCSSSLLPTPRFFPLPRRFFKITRSRRRSFRRRTEIPRFCQLLLKSILRLLNIFLRKILRSTDQPAIIATIFSKIISARWTFEITWERLRRRPWLFHNAGYSEAACCAAARISIGRFHF